MTVLSPHLHAEYSRLVIFNRPLTPSTSFSNIKNYASNKQLVSHLLNLQFGVWPWTKTPSAFSLCASLSRWVTNGPIPRGFSRPSHVTYARLYSGPLPSGAFITSIGKRKESLRAAPLLGQAGRQPEAIRPPAETPVREIRSQSNPEYSRIQARRWVFLMLATLGH